MAKRIVTLEIDTTAIRLMETGGGRVVKWASLALDPTLFEDGVISDPPALSAAVRQLMDSSGIRARDVIASVNGLYSVSRIVAVPTPPGEVITREAVLEAAEEIMPLSTDGLYLSWQIIASSGGVQQALVVGVPRDIIDAEMRALRAAGIDPHTLDLKALALARAVNKEQALILNIEPSSFDIIIVVNGIPEVIRTLAWQPDSLTEEERVEHLAMNLELTVGFYNSHHTDTPFDPATPFLITGQMSADPDLMEKLPARMGYHLESLAPPLECPKHMPVSQYAVNIGLALKGRTPAKSPSDVKDSHLPPDINLLPETYKAWRPSARQVYFTCAVIAGIVLLFPLYQMTSGAMDKTADLQAEYTNLNNRMQLIQLEIRNREPWKQAISEYNTIVDMGGSFTEDLRVINSEAEQLGVQVESVAHQGKSITLTGEAGDYTTFRNYITALEESGRFAMVTPPSEKYSYVTGGTIMLESIQ